MAAHVAGKMTVEAERPTAGGRPVAKLDALQTQVQVGGGTGAKELPVRQLH